MSEEEYSEYEEEEEVEEEEVEEQAEEVEEPEEREEEAEEEEDEENLNETEKAMLAAKKRHDNTDDTLMDYEEKRRMEREKEEDELKMLKEKQEKRRLEREQEEIEAAERRKQDDERRKKEEKERRLKLEEEKKKKEEDKMKKAQAMMGGGFAANPGGGRNFTIQPKADKGDKFGNIVQAKQEMGMTKEQQEEAKSMYMQNIIRGIAELREVASSELKAKIKEIHQRICRLETENYDLEKRHERQVYDLRELNERQRQVARNNVAKGANGPADDGTGRPPKIQISSKYDRQIDRRNFKERRLVYEHRNAFPCFPGVPPPPALFEKVIAKYAHEIQAEEDAAAEAEEEEEEEE